MTPEKWTRERRRELTRTALLDAAADVFARRGFEGASLDEIAETAGFTRGAIYKNFDDKEALFLALCDRLSRAALDAFAERLASRKQPGEFDQADLAAQLWHETYAAHPEAFVLDLEFRLHATRSPLARERYIAQYQATVALVRRFIDERLKQAGVRPRRSSTTIAEIIVAASMGFEQASYFGLSSKDVYMRFLEMLAGSTVSKRS